MCIKNAMELSLSGNTFAALKEDFDSILATTLGNMESKGADEAVITLKLGVSLEKAVFGSTEEKKELTKPTFKHDISSVMQVKNKKSGSLSGDYELVWDEDEKKYVMRKITNGQMTLFDEVDEGGNIVEHYEDPEYYETVECVSAPALIEAPGEAVEKSVSREFEWLSQFVDQDMHIEGSDGKYTVRSESGAVILVSAGEGNGIFRCDAETLEKHLGHKLTCVGYSDETGLYQICIECEECFETIFKLNSTDRNEDNADEAKDEYGYDAPESYEEDAE